jgi:HEPN domain-containing protein
VNGSKQNDIVVRLEELDSQMKSAGIPLRFRPLECFKKLFGPLPEGTERNARFDQITLWFVGRYGERMSWDQVVGRVPVLVRDELYLLQIPYVNQQTCVKLTDRIENLPEEIAKTFTRDEFDELGRKAGAATEAVSRLYNLHVDDHILEEIDRGLIARALFDFEHTATSLKQTGDTQNSIFHSHAAAEKFLKVAPRRTGSRHDLKNLRHDLPNIFRKLVDAQKRFSWLESSVEALHNFAPNMDIRYVNVGRTVQDAVTAFNAALSICGTLAGIWLFDVARGSPDSRFTPGHFYIDSAGRTFHCERLVAPDRAWLRLFMTTPFQGRLMADLELDTLNSCLYLEVTKSPEVQNLQANYDDHWKNRGKLVTPEEIGAKIASGPEGSYVTTVSTIKIIPQAKK